MINDEKINLMFENIKEVGLKFFSEISLAKLLENLNIMELEKFFSLVPEQFKDDLIAQSNLASLESIVKEQIEEDYLAVCNSAYYKKFLNDLANVNEFGRIDIDLSSYGKMDLGNIQFAINHSIDFNDELSVSAAKKMTNLIKNEIKEREKKNKPTFDKEFSE